jgi:methylmalonyl-CoA mutase N-terminal domain/subunit
VEALTSELERRAVELLARVEELGGSAKAIEAGFFQEEIARSAYAYQLAVERGEAAVVGVNKFADGAPAPVIALPDYSKLETEQVARVKTLRGTRDAAAVQKALAALAVTAPKVGTPGGELMPLIIAAVRARATVGEVSDTFERVWGHYRPA